VILNHELVLAEFARFTIFKFERPFDQQTFTALADDIIHKAPLPPRQIRPELSVRLEPVILKCLEKEQAKRYQSAHELRSDLERLSTGSVPLAARQKWLWRVLVASIVVLLLGATTWWYLLRKQATRSSAGSVPVRRSVAVLGFKNLSGNSEAAWLSTALSEMLNTELAAGEKLRTIPGEDVTHTKNDLSLSDGDSLGRNSLARLRRNLGTDYVVLGSYLRCCRFLPGLLQPDTTVESLQLGAMDSKGISLTRDMIDHARVYATTHPRRGRPMAQFWSGKKPLREKKSRLAGVA
jgi:hypothetical protein